FAGADPGAFSLGSGSPSSFTLAPGGSQALGVVFAPGSPGGANGTLTISSNAANDASLDVALSGTGEAASAPAIDASPAALGFGSVTVGESATETVSITNTGDADLAVGAVSVSGAAFALAGGTPTAFTLAPGASQNLAVVFAPATPGGKSGTLTVSSDAANDPALEVALSGSGEAVPVPAIDADPDALPFGAVVVGASETATVTVSNTGDAALTVSAVTLGGPNPGQFALASGTPTSFTLSPGSSQALSVTFAPTSPGSKSASLSVTSDASNGTTLDVALSGTGEAPPEPAIAASPTALAFGPVTVGASSAKTVTVTNTGDALLTVSAVSLSGSGAFALAEGTPTAFTLAPGAAQAVSVVFAPGGTGPKAGTLTLASDAANAAALDVALSGTAQPDTEPGISVAPNALGFGAVVVGETKTKTVVVTNTGDADLAVSAVTIAGANPGQFALAEGTLPSFTVSPGDAVDVSVVFAPTGVGAKSAVLKITSNVPTTPVVNVALQGTGEAPPPAELASFTLVDAETDEDIGPLEDGATYLLSDLPDVINVRANTAPAVVGSVRFDLNDDPNYQIDNEAPYALAGNTGDDYDPWSPTPGAYVLTATPYDGPNASGEEGVPLTVSFTFEAGTDADEAAAPERLELLPATPNPFQARTRIQFRLPEPTRVRLSVYTVLGSRVTALVDGVLGGGLHEADFDASGLASGVYFLRLETEAGVETQKLLRVR
ncbi:MAG: choice-of-anchor D domain-containing protein, partial [Rhodothermales bacterium]|nr:choice-of-anchor D domain-containing protein [Rhodothermales bacterium]